MYEGRYAKLQSGQHLDRDMRLLPKLIAARWAGSILSTRVVRLLSLVGNQEDFAYIDLYGDRAGVSEFSAVVMSVIHMTESKSHRGPAQPNTSQIGRAHV